MTQSVEERNDNKQKYFATRMYKALVEVGAALAEGESNLTPEQMGDFGEMAQIGDDGPHNAFRVMVYTWRDEAKRLGNIPDWQADSTPKTKDLVYPRDSQPSAK